MPAYYSSFVVLTRHSSLCLSPGLRPPLPPLSARPSLIRRHLGPVRLDHWIHQPDQRLPCSLLGPVWWCQSGGVGQRYWWTGEEERFGSGGKDDSGFGNGEGEEVEGGCSLRRRGVYLRMQWSSIISSLTL